VRPTLSVQRRRRPNIWERTLADRCVAQVERGSLVSAAAILPGLGALEVVGFSCDECGPDVIHRE
jgi:hypothetical protein